MAAAHAVGAPCRAARPQGQPFEPTAETVPAEPWWRGVALPPRGGWPAVEKSGADASVSDTPGDVVGQASEGTGEPETVPAS